jgi:hypothetical protein
LSCKPIKVNYSFIQINIYTEHDLCENTKKSIKNQNG